MPKFTVKRVSEGVYGVFHANEKVGDIDLAHLRQLYLENPELTRDPSSGASAQEDFDQLVKNYAAENNVPANVALSAVIRTKAGQELWEHIRLEQLAASERSRYGRK